MAKGGKKSSTAEQRATERALRIAYQVGRYEWLNGRPMSSPMMPVAITAPPPAPPKRERKSYWADPVERVLSELGNSIASDKPAAVIEKVRSALADEIKQSGRPPPGRGLICRKAGFWED
jgi:hypothetical protein